LKTTLLVVLATILLMGCGRSSPEKPAPAAQAATPAPVAKVPEDAERQAVAWIRKINTAQSDFFRKNRRYALTSEDLVDARLLLEEPQSTEIGYEIKLRPTAAADKYTILATPVAAISDKRHFYSDMTGKIRSELGRDATAESAIFADGAEAQPKK